ncbi:MAG: response regulator [Deltaproteobacteria bacterium]|nr:MAG: response regulator [Deltaproteobacteria bacterium]
MYKIVIATPRKDAFRAFGDALETAGRDIRLTWVRSGADALNAATDSVPDLIVVDDPLEDTDGVRLIRQLLGVNAMINTALVSPLSGEDFHESTEGLGILNNLPPDPDESDAHALLASLVEIVGPK